MTFGQARSSVNVKCLYIASTFDVANSHLPYGLLRVKIQFSCSVVLFCCLVMMI